MTRGRMIGIAAAGSAALLLGALAFQHIGGLAPCTLCIWQRWPHLAAVVIGVLALAVRGPVGPVLANAPCVSATETPISSYGQL